MVFLLAHDSFTQEIESKCDWFLQYNATELHFLWHDGEVETLRSAKPRCAGSIPARASITQQSITPD